MHQQESRSTHMWHTVPLGVSRIPWLLWGCQELSFLLVPVFTIQPGVFGAGLRHVLPWNGLVFVFCYCAVVYSDGQCWNGGWGYLGKLGSAARTERRGVCCAEQWLLPSQAPSCGSSLLTSPLNTCLHHWRSNSSLRMKMSVSRHFLPIFSYFSFCLYCLPGRPFDYCPECNLLVPVSSSCWSPPLCGLLCVDLCSGPLSWSVWAFIISCRHVYLHVPWGFTCLDWKPLIFPNRWFICFSGSQIFAGCVPLLDLHSTSFKIALAESRAPLMMGL